ncbi:phage tail protein [Sphingomonas sp. Sphisp140]|uniref:GTA baseplate fiber-binding domain-containing protein n=1 Tax=unclassified Sphingomonas TaxID=196159 RepID=UPI0039AFD7C1
MVNDDGVGGKGRANRSIAAASSVPRTLTLSHYDPARDYQIGVQRAGSLSGGPGEQRIELPAAIDAGGARTLAEAALLRADTERVRRSVHLGSEALNISPGVRVRIAGSPGIWRVDGWKLEAMAVSLDCVALAPEVAPIPAASGRASRANDVMIGRTMVHAFELPPVDDIAPAVPRLAVAAAGAGPAWRRAALLLSTDNGNSWQATGGTRGIAVIGEIRIPPGPASPLIEDRHNSVEVALAHNGMQLDDVDAAALDRGANLAMLGDELIQFANAQPLGDGRWWLSGLWRGRRGTEHAIGNQAPGDRFVLLDADTLAMIDLPRTAVGTEVQLLGEGAADMGDPATARATVDGISLLPLAPVHLAAQPLPEGGVQLRWTRRSRRDWLWRDHIDVTPEPDGERYRITLIPATGASWTVDTLAPEMTLPIGTDTSGLGIEVRQLGTAGPSPPATLSLPLQGEET